MNTDKITLNFGTVTVHDQLLIAEMNEGIVFDIPDNEQLLSLGSNIFGDKPYGYISNRVNSYSINPTVYLQTAQRSNIKAIAVVGSSESKIASTAVEKQFFKLPFEVFTTLEEARAWLQTTLKQLSI